MRRGIESTVAGRLLRVPDMRATLRTWKKTIKEDLGARVLLLPVATVAVVVVEAKQDALMLQSKQVVPITTKKDLILSRTPQVFMKRCCALCLFCRSHLTLYGG